MNDIKEAITDRIKSPYLGYSALAFIGLNWKAFFILYSLEGSPFYRLGAFSFYTDIYSLFIFPLIIGAGIAISSPWIKWIFKKISEIPFEGLKISEIRSENKILEEKLKIEKHYIERQSTLGQQVLTEAKLKQDLETITNTDARNKASSEIHAIRDILEREKTDALARLQGTMSLKDFISSEQFGNPTIIPGNKKVAKPD